MACGYVIIFNAMILFNTSITSCHNVFIRTHTDNISGSRKSGLAEERSGGWRMKCVFTEMCYFIRTFIYIFSSFPRTTFLQYLYICKCCGIFVGM